MGKVDHQPRAQVSRASHKRMPGDQLPAATKALRTIGKKQILGWKEFVTLPDLGNIRLLSKLDTGARTSALHADSLKFSRRNGKLWVKFELPDFHTSESKQFKLPVVEKRKVKSSIGSIQIRPVVLLAVNLAEQTWTTEVTLTNRSDMELPMLIGRSALKRRFIVDPARTQLASARHVSRDPTTGARERGTVPNGVNA